MKNYSLLLVVFLALVCCNCQKKTVENATSNNKKDVRIYEIPKVEYEANSRGFYHKISIEDKTVSIINERGGKPELEINVTEDDNKELATLYKNINLELLPSYKDPTQKRFYDGAAIAQLTITVDGKEYQSTSFDHGNPPLEIEKFVNKILTYSNKK
jgi:hypothetical protein